ncbi:MAG: hypothetical protein FWF94_08200 [Oscillospiraceae bacterium]|nr:hypothetical protein [Oscillospiraceae bacterium]
MTKTKIIRIIPSIILYISAVLLIAFAVWSFIYGADIIAQAKAMGQLPDSGVQYEIINYYMGSCGQYAVYAILLAAAGYILQRIQLTTCVPVDSVGTVNNSIDDDDDDDDDADELLENTVETKNESEAKSDS